MPSTRRSMAPSSPLKALKPLSANSANIPPPALTPGKKFKAELEKKDAELEKKDAENEALRNSIAELTDALSGLNVVKDKIDADVGNVGTSTATATAGAAAVAVATLSSSSSAAGVEAPPKKKKDKDAPIPSKTAYKFYCDARPKSKGGANNNMQQAWKASPPEIRQSYDAMAKADKARYARELATHEEEKAALEMYYGKKRRDMAMEFFDAHLTARAALERVDAEKRKGKKKKGKRDPEAPKRALSSYMYFVADQRESVTRERPDASSTDVIKTLGELWNRLEKGKNGKNGTKKYDDRAAEDKVRYEAEKKVYDAVIEERNEREDAERMERLGRDKEEAMKLMMQSRADAAASVNASSAANNAKAAKPTKKVKKAKDPNAPKQASNPYIFFASENRKSIKAGMPEVGRQWRESTEEEKAKYVEMACKDKERYAKEMKKYTAEKK